MEEVAERAKDPLEEKFESIAELMIGFKNAVRALVKDLPDEEVLRLAEICKKESEPGDDPFDRGSSKNFPMPMWAEASKLLLREVGSRRVKRDADEYMKRTGANYYCVACRGECTPEHAAELAIG